MNRATVRVRCFLEPEDWTGGELRLSRAESHHLMRVRRHEYGRPVEVFDGTGRCAVGRIDRIEGESAIIRVEHEARTVRKGTIQILAQAAIKGDRADLLVRTSVELGLDRLIWFQAEHSVVRLTGERAAHKIARWRSIAVEAAKQCGQSRVPDIVVCHDASAALRACPADTSWFLCSLDPNARPAREVMPERMEHPPGAAGFAVGPEGDFTAEEEARWMEAGAARLSLGPRILRSETASMVAMTLLAYALDGHRDDVRQCST